MPSRRHCPEIAKALCAESDQRLTDVGEQLFPFTTRGEYGRFFNGTNNIRFSNGSIVAQHIPEIVGQQNLCLSCL